VSSLPGFVQALLDPQIYPQHPLKVELMQTQMSFVFIAGDYVYKVKKPVNLGYLDYTTLEKRKFFCEKEVELNRRLCPDAYLGVIPITRDKGRIGLGGAGEVIEYAVRMRYLPQERMMNVLLAKNEVTGEMVGRVAERLVPFHQKAETNDVISQFGTIDAIKVNTEENFNQTEKHIGSTVSQKKFQHIRDYTNRFLANNASLFPKRVTGGRIRDCHGDLHAAHICFTDGICIYDCIEFNDRFRYCDVASEIAFLAMDLDHYGRADLSHHFVKDYVARSGDEEILRLLNFYKCYRAYVRGKVECFKSDDRYVGDAEREKSRKTARSYFDLADAYTWSKPVLFITAGLVGTGKTVLAQALAKRFGLAVLSSDVIRKQLADIPSTEHRFEEFSSGIYAPEFTRKTYDELFNQARRFLSEGTSVVLDASFIKSGERVKARDLAKKVGADFYVLECILDEETIKQRLEQRLKVGTVSDGRWEVYVSQKQKSDPITGVPPEKHFVVDAAKPTEENIQGILDKIEQEAGH
jgi:aminoglycoside phosphotransferase family enzyme/predicted kinase